MRIISGEFRGRRLLGPASQTTRPITDRAKQSLFDILAPLLPDSVVYDLFAGTGSMGLECLSRGAAAATFFEADRPALKRLQQNIRSLGLDAKTQVVSGDLFHWFNASASGKLVADRHLATLAFLDPPYRYLVEYPDQLQRLTQQLPQAHLTPDATVVFRHDAAHELALPSLTVYDKRTYGSMAIELLALSKN